MWAYLHRVTAARMTGKALDDVTAEERKGAKAVNFGSIYGQGAAGLVGSAWANFDTVLGLAEARAWQDAFAASYPQLVRWRREHYERCEERGYIVIGKDAETDGIGRIWPKSRLGRDESYYTRCCNLPIQGACADASMLALAYADDRLFDAGVEGGPVAWLHDEIVLEVRADQAEQRGRDPQTGDDRRLHRDFSGRANQRAGRAPRGHELGCSTSTYARP